MPRLRPPLIVSLGRSQIASLTATLADFGCLILLVEVGHVWYVAAVAAAAFVGAVVNFFLGRHWSFVAVIDDVRGQAVRYAMVAAMSLILNSIGVYVATEYFAIHYLASKALIAFLIGILFNFPLHRRFVFPRHTYVNE
jgi:putative flippase GtrA